MSSQNTCDVIPLFPDSKDESEVTGWDPYIFSIVADLDRTYTEERRRVPRPLTASRRRALLLATRKKRTRKNR